MVQGHTQKGAKRAKRAIADPPPPKKKGIADTEETSLVWFSPMVLCAVIEGSYIHGKSCVRAAACSCAARAEGLCVLCGWEPVGVLHGQRVSVCSVDGSLWVCCTGRGSLCALWMGALHGQRVSVCSVDGSLWVCCTGRGSVDGETVGVLHGQRVSVCSVDGSLARAEGLCVLCGWEPCTGRGSLCALWMGACGCAARADGLCGWEPVGVLHGQMVSVDGSLWVCCTSRGSLWMGACGCLCVDVSVILCTQNTVFL